MVIADHCRSPFASRPVRVYQGLRIDLEVACGLRMDIFCPHHSHDRFPVSQQDTAAFLRMGVARLRQQFRGKPA